jgi:5-methylcytosine-specific restriction endonuclease McrA
MKKQHTTTARQRALAARRAKIVSSKSFIKLFEKWRKQHPQNKRCAKGMHRVCAANALVADMRRELRYSCNPCWLAYMRAYNNTPKMRAYCRARMRAYKKTPKMRAYYRAYYRARNKTPKWQAYYRAYYRARNKTPKMLAYYRARNKTPKRQAYYRAYNKTPKWQAYRRAANHKRRARVLGNGGSWKPAEFAALCAKYRQRCLRCGKRRKLTPDHIKPVCRGGRNTIGNLQPLCLSCNCSKNARTIDYRKRPHPNCLKKRLPGASTPGGRKEVRHVQRTSAVRARRVRKATGPNSG